jgi:hypothetical protein
MRVVAQVRDIVLTPGEEIIDAKDVATLFEQAVDEMGAEESGAAGHHDPLTHVIIARHSTPFACDRRLGVPHNSRKIQQFG